MIDYSLTFTKRGRKPYVTLTGKGGSHFFWSHICHFWLKFLRVIFFPKSKNNDIEKLIKCYLAFQDDFTTKRDGGIFLPG